MKRIKNVGIMGNPFRAMAGLDSVYGYDVAVNDNMDALMQYGSFDKMSFFFEPNQYQEAVVRRKYRSLSRKKKTSIELDMVSEYDLINKMKNPEIDVLHNLGMEFSSQVFYRERMAQNPFPITYTIHGASYPYYITDFYLKKLFMPFKEYDSLICTSNAVKKVVENILETMQYHLKKNGQATIEYKGRLDVLPLGVDTDKFYPIDKEMAREKFNIPKDAFVMLWIGRFSAYDKADLIPLLLAVSRLKQNNPNKKVVLVIAGHDRKNMPLMPAMCEYSEKLGVSDNVIFYPEQKMTERNDLYAAADVFVSPIDNIQETFGLTPIEAMACGVPQVVSDWDGYKDTVVDGVTGFKIPTLWAKCDNDICESGLFPSEPMHRSAIHHFILSQSVAVDLDVFVNRIQLLINDESLLRRMSEASVNRAKEIFSWKNVIPKYEDLWLELMEKCEYAKASQREENKLDFIIPRYYDYFKGYATKSLTKSDIVCLTDEGQLMVDGIFPLPKHYEIENSLNMINLAKKIADYLSKEGENTITNIISFMDYKFESQVIRASLWLIKQGFARVKN
ncbi:MAG: glycosyltransferase family 4 protein [Clostridium sp.]|nr:glycosyltransferase family 4 protein [Clostridium sp.]